MGRFGPRTLLTPEVASLPDPVLDLTGLPGPLDFPALFGRQAPVELDVGCGKGRLLLEEAARRADTDFVGIEHSRSRVRLVCHRLLLGRLPNVRLITGDAASLLAHALPAASLQAIHVLFPDPWPKRRHRPRRLVNARFLSLASRALRPAGALNFATDFADYAEQVREATRQVPELVPEPAFRLPSDLTRRTHFGAKLARRGATLHLMSWSHRP